MRRIAAAGEIQLPDAPPPPTFDQLKAFRDRVALAEAATPVDRAGPLPSSVTTLAFVREDAWPQYVRRMDGTFELAWISQDDTTSLEQHLEAVGEGKLAVMPPGRTPASLVAEEQAKLRAQAVILAELDEAQRIEREAQLAASRARLEAQQKAEREALDREHRRMQGVAEPFPDDLRTLVGLSTTPQS